MSEFLPSETIIRLSYMSFHDLDHINREASVIVASLQDTPRWKDGSSPVGLYSWWPFAQQSELDLIKDNDPASAGADDPTVLQATHHPDGRLCGGSGHVGNLLAGEGQG